MQALSGWECDNPVYGRANNPWDLARTPGGSSGGEGAIIAAGGSPLGLASDLGGSIRFPAYFCGVHGFKPTSGRLTNEDTPAEHLQPGPGRHPAAAGPIGAARGGPVAGLVDPLHGATRLRCRRRRWRGRDPAAVDVAGLRIGYYTDDGYFPASPAIRRAVEEAAAALDAMGADVVQMQSPDTEEGMRIFAGIFSSDGSRRVRSVCWTGIRLCRLRGHAARGERAQPVCGRRCRR